jgi:hypothetical protein
MKVYEKYDRTHCWYELFALLFCIGVKHGLSHQGMYIDGRCLRTWGLRRIEYLELRGRKWWEAGEDCIMRSFHNLFALPNINVIQVKENQVARSCNMLGRNDKCIKKFWSENLKEETKWKT